MGKGGGGGGGGTDPFLFYGQDKECGTNDDHLPALTLAVTIYFKGIGHDMFFLSLYHFL